MSVKLREVFGWLLVLIGLGLFAAACLSVANRRIFSSGPFIVAGFVVFRGGLHLIKVATAAYACQQAAAPAGPRAVARAVARPKSFTPGTPRGGVVPGPNGAAADD